MQTVDLFPVGFQGLTAPTEMSRRVHAAPAAEIIPNMEAAALQIPARSLAGALFLAQPEVDEGFLNKVIAQRWINGQLVGHDPHGLAYLKTVKKHVITFDPDFG